MAATPHTPKAPSRRRDIAVATICGAVVALMVSASYAAVPFYDWFCRTTGFGGVTQVSAKVPEHVLGRTITVRFDSNIAPGLPWKFEPERTEMQVHIGEVATANYKVTNMAARAVTAQAGYNVSPPQAGLYFTKINCFCFTQQTMKPGETREMSVVFYVDPSMVKDHDLDEVGAITLSYTFFPVRAPVADAATGARNKL